MIHAVESGRIPVKKRSRARNVKVEFLAKTESAVPPTRVGARSIRTFGSDGRMVAHIRWLTKFDRFGRREGGDHRAGSRRAASLAGTFERGVAEPAAGFEPVP